MRISKLQAIEFLESDDLIGIGMDADAARRKFHPGRVATYIIDRNINHTNFCTEYCSFCAFYRPMGHEEGYVLPKETIGQKIQETIDLGGTGVLMQGGVNPDLKIGYFEDLFSWIKKNYQIHLHCLSAPEILTIAEVSHLTIADTIKRLRDAGLDSIPGAGAEILDDDAPPTISISDATVTEGGALDVFVAAGSGGLQRTSSIIYGPDGNLYVGETSDSNRVLRYDGETGAFIDVFVSSNSGVLAAPQGLAFGADGNFYVASLENGKVLRYRGDTGEFIDEFASFSNYGATFVLFDSGGTLYIGRGSTDDILRYDGTTGEFDVFVAAGRGGLDLPRDATSGPKGDLYVTSVLTNQVLKYDGTTGAFIDAFVDGESGGLDGPRAAIPGD